MPRLSGEDYVGVRLLKALVEAWFAPEFLGKGLVRDAAGRVFQSWRAFLACLIEACA
ncbi:hypothetical protein JCM16161A_08420 [Vulcanisaeta sp. JCM 16161]|uniref:PaREP1 family protein n=1 Tax=Vulcanisaeta sp. JCM 16161 TaxID=1295372 RepID=UPI00406CBB03